MKPTTIGEVSKVVKDLNAWLKKQSGDSRALLSELKDDLIQINMVLDHGLEISDVLDEISDKEYKRLQSDGFSFNSIKRSKIAKRRSLKGTDIEAWGGKSTEELIGSIYDKINELKKMYPKLKGSPKFRPRVRTYNIRKRILLLLNHVRS